MFLFIKAPKNDISVKNTLLVSNLDSISAKVGRSFEQIS